MALIKSDRVKETSTSTGNGTFSLAGAATGYRTFASVCVVGDTFFYGISNQTSGEWETGLGTYSATNTLTRTTVHASSNSGAIVTFGAGTKEVFLTASARYLERIVDNELFTSVGSSTSVVAVNDGPQPQLDLAFSADKTLTARYGPTPSYSRASTGTYFNASGVLASAVVNEPRFDHVLENGVWISKGLLIEEQRTNTTLYSSNIGNAYWIGTSTKTADFGISPDATQNAARITGGGYFQSGGISKIGTQTFSFWAKTISGNSENINVFLDGGTVTTALTITGSWVRYSVTQTFASTNTGTIGIFPLSASILFYGPQLETGAFPTSYIPTTTASVTRSADVCQITGGDFSGFYNAIEGSVCFEGDSSGPTTASDNYFLICSDGATFNNAAPFIFSSGTLNSLRHRIRAGGSDIFNITTSEQLARNTPIKLAQGYRSGDSVILANGSIIDSRNNSFSTSSISTFFIGYAHSGSAQINGHIARLRYFNTRLANQTLVQLSGGINNLVYKSITGSGNATVTNNYTNINVSVPNPLPVANGGTGGTTAVTGAVNLIKSAPNDGAEYTLKSKQISGTPSFYWVDSTGYAPTLDLLFAADKSLTAYTGPTPSYSRASTGTYFTSSGVLTSAAINGPRFDHVFNGSSWVSKGLLVEEQRTNVCTYSEDFTNGVWSKTRSSISSNATTAPDAASTADKLIEGASSTTHLVTFTTVTGAVFSVFAKASERSWIALQQSLPGNFCYFNLSSGSVGSASGATGSITSVGNGWYRCSIAVTSASSMWDIFVATGDNGASYTGDGTSGVFIWGAQIEAGSFPTSYIPTTTAAVTRSADVCQITGTDFSGFWNASEGSLVYEADSSSNVIGNHFVFLVSDGTFNNQYQSSRSQNNAYTDVGFWVKNGNVWQALIYTSAGAWLQGATSKDAMAYKVDDFAFSDDGSAVLTDASGTLPTVNRMEIGGSSLISAALNGHIARLRYYPVRIPNATLQVLST
jgi:hypothetical protein